MTYSSVRVFPIFSTWIIRTKAADSVTKEVAIRGRTATEVATTLRTRMATAVSLRAGR